MDHKTMKGIRGLLKYIDGCSAKQSFITPAKRGILENLYKQIDKSAENKETSF